MSTLSVTAQMRPDVVDRIQWFREKNGIKHFGEAVEAYILSLEANVECFIGPIGQRGR